MPGAPSRPRAEPLQAEAPTNVTEQLALDALRLRMLGRAVEPRRLGRYEIRRRIGQGGMGVVYCAYDPSLRRTVALKLVTGSRGRRTVRRIIREAQSQARLTHPHVVEIYDVGASGMDVYITMELVEGPTLLAWLAADPPHSWRDVLDVFMATGRGLVAAHEAGLVHRDFKPANVLFTRAGRPKVADFGLAIRSQDTNSMGGVSEPPPLEAGSARLTETGAVLGTPLYMAPEQHRSERVDARADQFAFCVALFEALVGAAPFSGETIDELCRQKDAGVGIPTERRGTPRRVLSVLVRGLHPQPHQRWPSMTELLAALEHAARPRRLWLLGGAVIAIALAGSALGEDRSDPCSTDLLAASWSEDSARLEAAFEASALPHAHRSWATLRTGLDAHVEEWSATLAEVCGDDARTEPGDPRLRCLRQRQRKFEALVLVMARPGEEVLADPGLALGGLESPSSCLDPQVEPSGDRSEDPRWAAIDERVAEAEALNETSWFDDARAAALDAVTRAHEAGFDTLEARASLQLGLSYLAVDDSRSARPHLEQSYFLADAKGDHLIAAVAASKVVYALSVGDGSESDAARWAEHAMAHLEQMGGDGPVGLVEVSIGMMWHRRGDYAEAAVHEMRAAEWFTNAHHPNHPFVGDALSNAGNAYVFAGEIERGLEVLDRAARIFEVAYGLESPKRASAILNSGNGLYRAGRYTEALGRFDETLAILDESPNPERRMVGQTLVNRAITLSALDKHDAALENLEEARRIMLETVGAEHSLMSTIDMNIGYIHFGAGRMEEALQHFARANTSQIGSLGADHPEVALTEHNMGVAFNSLDRYREAEDHLRRSAAAFEARLGADADYTALSQMELGRALDGLGEHAEALELVSRALRILKSKGEQHDRFVLMGTVYRGRILRSLQHLEEAQTELDVALRRARELVDDDPTLTTELFVERAHLARARGDRAAARRELDAAREIATAHDEAKHFLPIIEDELRANRR